MSQNATDPDPRYSINASYFGPSVLHTTYDLTQMVYQADGDRRNMPQIQFYIRTPLGPRVYVTYRDGIDGISTQGTSANTGLFDIPASLAPVLTSAAQVP